MNRHRSSRRDQGSALVIATIMIVITAAMIGILLAAPQAQLAQVATSVAKQRALSNADAGAREAMLVLQANATKIGTWLPLLPGGTNALISGQLGTGQTAPGTMPNPAPPTYATSPSFFPCELATTSSLPMNPATGFPAFVSTNWRQFGDRTKERGRFAFAILATAQAGYYRVLIEGQSLAGSAPTQGSTGAITGALTVSSLLEVVVYLPNPITPSAFGAVSFANASGGSGNAPTQPFGTAGVQTQIMLESDKNKTFTNGWGANTGTQYPLQPAGTPAPTLAIDTGIGGAGSTPAAGTPPTSILSDLSLQKQYLAIADAAKTKAAVATNATLSTTWSSGGYTFYYNHFAAGSTIDGNSGYGANPLNVHGMNNGIVVFDLEDNVTIDLQDPQGTGSNIHGAFFSGNGIGSFGGTVLFIQRGRVNVSGDKFFLVSWNPANSSDNILSFNQAAIEGALQVLTLPPPSTKIASYRVVQ